MAYHSDGTEATEMSHQGTMYIMDIWIDPKHVDDYIALVTPMARRLGQMPEARFGAVAANPKDKGHFRATSCWTQDAAWYKAVSSAWHPAFQVWAI
jgi:hypothetical protein